MGEGEAGDFVASCEFSPPRCALGILGGTMFGRKFIPGHEAGREYGELEGPTQRKALEEEVMGSFLSVGTVDWGVQLLSLKPWNVVVHEEIQDDGCERGTTGDR